MPESKKRVIEKKETNQKHVNVTAGKGGRILVAVLAISMVAALLIAAVILVVQSLL